MCVCKLFVLCMHAYVMTYIHTYILHSTQHASTPTYTHCTHLLQPCMGANNSLIAIFRANSNIAPRPPPLSPPLLFTIVFFPHHPKNSRQIRGFFAHTRANMLPENFLTIALVVSFAFCKLFADVFDVDDERESHLPVTLAIFDGLRTISVVSWSCGLLSRYASRVMPDPDTRMYVCMCACMCACISIYKTHT